MVLAITLVISLVFAYLTRDVLLRVRVARVMDEQALLRRAIQNYSVDWKEYPSVDGQLDVLVAPTTYIASLPQDVFSTDRDQHPSYRYYRQPGGGIAWILVSPGPDGLMDFSPWSQAASLAMDASTPDANAVEAEVAEDAVDLGGLGGANAPAAWSAIRRSRTNVQQNTETRTDAGDDEANGAPLTAPVHRRRFLDYVSSVSYDPTNGSTSAGDIILVAER